MLQTANRSDLIVFEDLVDDATVAPPRRPKTFESTKTALPTATPSPVVQNGPVRPDFVPADPAFAERVRASFDAQAMMNTLGVGITELGPGWIDLEFDHHEDFTQQHGFKHAGAIATALDSACGYAAFSLMPADAAVLTVEYKINLLRPARAERYRASAAVVKPGRTLTVCTATAAPADNNSETIAVMTATLMTLIGTDISH